MFSKLRGYINQHPLNKQFLGLIAILVIVAILPLIVIVAQQQQETRQHASEPIAAPFPDGDTYQSIDVGSLGGGRTEITDINDKKQVVGKSKIVNGGYEHAFLWENGSIKDLGTLGGCCSRATGINNKGQVVGTAVTGSGQGHAFLWENGSIKDLGVLGKDNSVAEDINDNGQIVGSSTFSNSSIFSHAFLYENGAMKDLGTLGGVGSFALKINNKGQIVGFSNLSGSAQHAFLYEGNAMKDLGALADNGNSSFAFSINDNSQIIGYSSLSPSGGPNSHAFLYENGAMKDLGTLGGSTSSANDINNVGEIIGYAVDSTNVNNLVIWKNNQPQKPQYGNLTYPPSINNNGDYAANSVFVIKNSSPSPTPVTSITMTPQTLTSGDNIIVSWNVTNASVNDYIRVLTASGNIINAGPNGIAPSNNCNLNNIPGTTAVKAGSCSFTSAAIRDLGIFKLGYYNSQGTLLTTSTNFTVNAASTGTLSAFPLTVLTNSTNAKLNLSWNGVTNAHAKDYINYLNADDYTGTAAGHTYWPSNNCAWSNGSIAIISGSCSIETPFLPGRYKLVYYSGGSVPVGQPAPILAVSNVITVSTPSPTPADFCTVCVADVNKDGVVDGQDFSLQRACYGKPATGSCAASDLDKSGNVTISDINCVTRFFGKVCPK